MTKTTLRLFIILTVSAALLFTLDRLGWLAWGRLTWEILTVPIRRALYLSGVGLATPKGTISELERQGRELMVLSTKLKILESENQALRRQLEVDARQPSSQIVAMVIGLERYLIVDRGSLDGIKSGDSVISEGVLVGRVLDTSSTTSRILLPTDPDSKIPAWTSKLTRGIVSGSFGRTLTIENVLQGDPLSVDEVVLTSGEGYLQNVAIGSVTSLEGEPRSVYKKGILTPLIDYRSLRLVIIVSH